MRGAGLVVAVAGLAASGRHGAGVDGFSGLQCGLLGRQERSGLVARRQRAAAGWSLASSAGTEESASSGATLVRGPDSSVEVTLTADGRETQKAFNKACLDASKMMTIPGFRQGSRIPPVILETNLINRAGKGADIGPHPLRTQAITAIMGEHIEGIIRDEHGLEPIGEPTFVESRDVLAERFVPGEPIEFKVKCDIWPEITWVDFAGQEKPYFGLKGSYKRKPFNQERYDASMTELRDRYAALTDAPPDHAVAMGDSCRVTMVGYWAAEDGVTKGDPLPNAASGDDVEVILGGGRYMEGLVEGLVGGKAGETRTIYVTFPTKLKDKSLAGKKAVFDVTINSVSHRTLPEVTDDFANKVRAGLTAEALEQELRKAIDQEDEKDFVGARNDALGKALAARLSVQVPDSLLTKQARDKFAIMMTEMRDNGMDDEAIKKMISPEAFEKYKNIVKDDIRKDFRISMAVDYIATNENIQVPPHEVEQQMEAIRKDMQDGEQFDENVIRSKVEATIQRKVVFDYLADYADLKVQYEDEPEFDENLMNSLAEDSIAREKAAAAAQTPDDDSKGKSESVPSVEEDAVVVSAEVEPEAPEPASPKEPNPNPAAAAELKQRTLLAARLAVESEAKARREKQAREAQALAKVAAELNQRSLLAARVAADAAERERKAAQEAEDARLKAAASEQKQRALLTARLEIEAVVRERLAALKAAKEQRLAAVAAARMQPKPADEEAAIAAKYGAMTVEDRAFNILVDLGMIDISPDPEDPDYDSSLDDELV